VYADTADHFYLTPRYFLVKLSLTGAGDLSNRQTVFLTKEGWNAGSARCRETPVERSAARLIQLSTLGTRRILILRKPRD